MITPVWILSSDFVSHFPSIIFYLSAESWIGKGRSLHAAAMTSHGLEFTVELLAHLPSLET